MSKGQYVSDWKCKTCDRPQNNRLSRFHTISSTEQYYNFVIKALVDLLLGIILGVGLYFVLSKDSSPSGAIRFVEWMHHRLVAGVAWLGSYPIGFKLNQPLTEKLGKELVVIIRLHEGIVLNVLRAGVLKIAALLSPLLGIVFGATGLLAILQTLFLLVTLHFQLLSAGFRTLYFGELSLLAALWRVFRGKKLNVLRQRTDTMEYDSMQLLLGTILFAISLFLFTTVLVYHLFFATLRFGIGLANGFLAGQSQAISQISYGAIAIQVTMPHVVDEAVYLKSVDSNLGVFELATTARRSAITHASGVAVAKSCVENSFPLDT